ncbi:hypothetical protein KKA00_05965 [bacterium]|nr:hypothetical protein [bacterium]MBU1651744.1 hypothetical protein [bacterium]
MIKETDDMVYLSIKSKVSASIGVILILIGSLIYVVWREETLLMFYWFRCLGLSPIVDILREQFAFVKAYLPVWTYCSLPNSLWLVGGILLFASIWGDVNKERNIWCASLITIAVGSEILQSIELIPGTFDVNDLLLMGIMLMIVLLSNNIRPKENSDEENPQTPVNWIDPDDITISCNREFG